VLQLLGTFTAFFGPFSTAVALIPIVIGAAMCGVGVGAWLGLVFGLVVLFSGGANLFLAVDVLGTLVTVLVKGTACGLVAALAYRALERFNLRSRTGRSHRMSCSQYGDLHARLYCFLHG